MCSCETSFGSIFLFEIGASVDGAPVVMSRVSLCVLKHHHCKGITLQAAAC